MKKLWIGLMLLVLVLAAAGMATAEETITPNTPKTVEISIPGEVAVFQFTPTQTGTYRYYSSSINDGEWLDVVGWLLDSGKHLIKWNDDYGDDAHFSIMRQLTAGRTYYFATSFFSNSTVGSYRIQLDLIDGVYAEAGVSTVYTWQGQGGTAEVTAFSPNGGLTYQWYDGNTAISGATGSKYTFPALTAAKTFRCVVKDAANKTQEVTVDAKIRSGLSVSGNNTEVEYGGSATLTVTATATYGADQLTYQWWEEIWDEDGQWIRHELEGETDSSIILTNVTTYRSFFCQVTDINGDSTDRWMSVGISGGDTSVHMRSDGESEKTVVAGSSVTMTVSAESGYPITRYQWYKVDYNDWDSTWRPIEGATDISYTLTNCYASGTYACQAMNSAGYYSSAVFDINVTNGFTATADGDDEIEMSPGETKTMKVKTTNSVGTVKYQWYRYEGVYARSVAVQGANSASYQLSGDVGSESWYCIVTDGSGTKCTVQFSVKVESGFSATADSATELTKNVGDTATLKVKATGTNVSYRWYESEYNSEYGGYYSGYELIEDAETDSLTITCNGRRQYECRVFDPYGHSENIAFTVQIDNGFSVTATQTYYSVEPGKSVTLSVNGECTNGTITYRWKRRPGDAPGSYTVKESGEPFLTIDAVGPDNRGTYELYAYDEYGNSISIEFTVSIENNLSARAIGSVYIAIQGGADIQLAVEASCDYGEPNYQWYEEPQGQSGPGYYNLLIPNETQATLQLTNIQKAANYYCQVTDAYGGLINVWFFITIDNNLTVGPANGETDLSVSPGEPVTMTVEASCTSGTLTYQWYEEQDNSWYGDNPISGETSASYTLDAANRTGRYVCVVKDEYGNEDSQWFWIYIDNNLTVEPVNGETNLTVGPGEPVTMTVEASCTSGTLTYQWYEEQGNSWYGDNPISGETSASYTLSAANGAGRYVCVVRDVYGNKNSQYFWIYIDNNLTIEPVNGETNLTVDPGEPVTMTVEASCTSGTLTYQWYEEKGNNWYGDNPISGETSASYTLEAVNRAGRYVCVVRDQYGNEDNQWFWIYIDNNLTVGATNGKTDFTVSPGAPVTMTVEASCTSGTLTYQWYEEQDNSWYGDNPISGETSASYTLEAVNRAGRYVCVVRDQYGNEDNQWFYIHIDNNLTVEPANGKTDFTVSPGTPVTMTVEASCTSGTLTYRWYRDDEFMEGKTGSSLAILSLTRDDSGSYQCVVTDEYGNTENVYFYVEINNDLTMRNLTPGTVYPAPDGTVTMTVEASCTVGDVTYAWSKGVRIYDQYGEWDWMYTALSETGPSLTVTDASDGDRYICHATDAYGSSTSLQFYVSIPDNGNIWIQSVVYNADEPGGEAIVSLSVWSSQGPLTYTWYRRDGDEGEQTQIQGVTGPQLIIQNVTSPIDIWCEISNKTGMTTYSCTVAVDIHLEISSKNPSTKLLGPNETETLTVTATSNDNQLTYQWSKNGVRLENVTGNSLQISGQDEPGYYECVVNASYGNSQQYDFYRATATEGATLALNQTVNAEITANCRMRAFSFTPTESGEYSFYSDNERDTYGYLFNDEYEMITYNDDGGYGTNFLITRELAAGETVYLAVRYYSILGDPGTIPVGVMTGEYRIEKDGGTLYLHKGQSAYLPEDYRNSDSFDSAESGNGQVLAVNGRRITAGTAGQTTLHARYNEIQVIYTVIVEDTGVFALPEELEEIEDEAFAGVTIQYLEVGASVYNIYNGRFSGTGIHQALFRGDNTVISDGALGSEPFTIICYPNSQAYYYAQNHNCPWLSLE